MALIQRELQNPFQKSSCARACFRSPPIFISTVDRTSLQDSLSSEFEVQISVECESE
jgi:hypothetical protein